MEETPDQPPERVRPAWAALHLWQIQGVRDLLVLFALLGLFVLGERLSLVTVPVLLALALAYMFEPIVMRLARISKITRRLASGSIAVGVVFFVVVPLGLAVAFAALQGVNLATRIATQTSAVIASVDAPDDAAKRAALGQGAWGEIRDLLVEVQSDAEPSDAKFLGVDRDELRRGLDYTVHFVRQNAERIGSRALSTSRGALTLALSTFTSLGRFVFGLFLTFFFFFFVSSGWPSVKQHLQELIPVEQHDKTLEILGKMDRAISGFIRGRVTIALLQAGFYSVGFWLIGVPAPLILGPAVAFVTIIPYAGLLMVPLVVVLLWLEGHTGLRGSTWWILLAPLVWYQIAQALDDYVLTPLIQGKSTDLDTPAILFASIGGGILFGFFGLLVAIPLAACAKILVKELVLPRYRAWTRGQAQDFLPL